MEKPQPIPNVYDWPALKAYVELFRPSVAAELERALSRDDPPPETLLCVDASVAYWQGLSPSTSAYLEAEFGAAFFVRWR